MFIVVISITLMIILNTFAIAILIIDITTVTINYTIGLCRNYYRYDYHRLTINSIIISDY